MIIIKAFATLRGYAIAAASMLAATVFSLLVQPFLSGHSANSLFYVLAVLASAWLGGYGPAAVASLIGLFAAPFLFTPHFDLLRVDFIRAALVISVSLLIAYAGKKQRTITAALIDVNRDLLITRNSLEDRVRARTLELQESNEELKKLNSALNEFTYSASHDLQQPLRTMATQSQLLQRKYGSLLDDEANGYINTIVQSARRMNDLLADLLAYARSVNLKPREAPTIDASTVLADALSNLNSQIVESGATITVGQLPLTQMHRFHLLELFQNIIENAIKYRGQTPPQIDISYDEMPSSRIAIRDNGIGIAPEYATQVFGLFKRLHSPDKYEGTGVGLAICEAIIDRYNGRIWVEPNHPTGSTFCFTLPATESAKPLHASSTV